MLSLIKIKHICHCQCETLIMFKLFSEQACRRPTCCGLYGWPGACKHHPGNSCSTVLLSITSNICQIISP